MKPSKFLLLAVLLTALFSSCKKETTVGNLKVTVSIPSTGFQHQNAVEVRVVDMANTSLQYVKTTTNGNTIYFDLNTGTYAIYGTALSSNASLQPVSSNYGTYGYIETQVNGSDLVDISLAKWCQGDNTGTGGYCN